MWKAIIQPPSHTTPVSISSLEIPLPSEALRRRRRIGTAGERRIPVQFSVSRFFLCRIASPFSPLQKTGWVPRRNAPALFPSSFSPPHLFPVASCSCFELALPTSCWPRFLCLSPTCRFAIEPSSFNPLPNWHWHFGILIFKSTTLVGESTGECGARG